MERAVRDPIHFHYETVSQRNARLITALIARIGGHLDWDLQHLSDDVHVHL